MRLRANDGILVPDSRLHWALELWAMAASRCLAFSLLLLGGALPPNLRAQTPAPQIVYVNQSVGAGSLQDGSSWANAYRELRNAAIMSGAQEAPLNVTGLGADGIVNGVTTSEAIDLLEAFRAGRIPRDKVLQSFQAAPLADLGFAQVDTHRALRKGFPEVIFGAGKTPDQVVKIAAKLLERDPRVLITRVTLDHVRAVRRKFRRAVHHEEARCLTIEAQPLSKRPGIIAVICAGTSDLPVAEEAAVTAEVMGNTVDRIRDVGVAGLHRLLAQLERLQTAHVIVAVAGMEGALPGVVAGLVSRPVIAVPTSVGYGANLGGFATLFSMLNSCSSGMTVVNIDNGFGAGYAASQINALASERLATPTPP